MYCKVFLLISAATPLYVSDRTWADIDCRRFFFFRVIFVIFSSRVIWVVFPAWSVRVTALPWSTAATPSWVAENFRSLKAGSNSMTASGGVLSMVKVRVFFSSLLPALSVEKKVMAWGPSAMMGKVSGVFGVF